MPRRFRLAAIVGVLSLLYGVWAFGERSKRRPTFCVSCHLFSGESLHQSKMKTMTADPPQSLAGVHFHAKPEPLGCYDCHGGETPTERAKVFLLEAKNTLRYFIGRYEEPTKAERRVPDAFCYSCHANLKEKAVAESFHSFASHDRIKEVDCVSCHVVHAQRTEAGFIDKKRAIEQCGICHKNAESSPSALRSLQAIR